MLTGTGTVDSFNLRYPVPIKHGFSFPRPARRLPNAVQPFVGLPMSDWASVRLSGIPRYAQIINQADAARNYLSLALYP